MESQAGNKSSESLIEQKYKILNNIGEGGFCVVMRGVNLSTNEAVAIKKIDKSKPVYKKFKGNEAKTKMNNIMIREAAVMQALNHPNLMKLIELIDDGKHIYLVLQFAEGGDLFNRILNHGKFSESSSRTIITQIISGIKFMHSKGYVHRDIKAENILFIAKSLHLRILITDFGLSRERSEIMYTNCGTVVYSAPELLINKMTKEGYTYKIDNWGIGVLTYFILSGRLPFTDPDQNENEIKRLILSGKVAFNKSPWKFISRFAKEFVEALLDLNPETRLELEEAEYHTWISRNIWPKNEEIQIFPLMERTLKLVLASVRWKVLINITLTVNFINQFEYISNEDKSNVKIFESEPNVIDP